MDYRGMSATTVWLLPSKEVKRNEREILAERRNPGLHRHRGRDQRPGGEPGRSDRRSREMTLRRAQPAPLHVTGVFIMDKKPPSHHGHLCITTPKRRNHQRPTGNVPAGYAAADAEASDATVLVNIGDPNEQPRRWPSGRQPGAEKYGAGKVYDITVATGTPDRYRADIRRGGNGP